MKPLDYSPSPASHRLAVSRGREGGGFRLICSCGRIFDAADRLDATDALEGHQRERGTTPQRGGV